MKWSPWFTIAMLLTTLWGPAPLHAEIDHHSWDQLLHKYVDDAGLVDYEGVQSQRDLLDAYLTSLADIDPTGLDSKEQLALWINAYNACVLKGVLDHPGMISVQDVKGFFDKVRYPVVRASLTLNQIEERGRALGDWRIHMAVVCASSSCPSLRHEAYAPARLEEQLTEQAKRFLADETRGLRLDGNTLWLSKIFKWYAKDFVPTGRPSAATLMQVLAPYAPPPAVQAAEQPGVTLQFFEYDWSLNNRGGPR